MDESEALRTLPISSLKFIPNQRDRASWVQPSDESSVQFDANGLAVPPDALLAGYADSADVYLSSGALHVQTMREKLQETGFALASAKRALDLGCGIGRMIRHLASHNPRIEAWGVDISSPHIQWCKWHLSPPYHFATTTTLPHLPFPDGHFDLVYAGSVFTHIEDLADAWLLEVRRVLSDHGRAYVTLHDENTIELLETHPVYSQHWLGDQLRACDDYQRMKNRFGMIVIGRDVMSQVFYHRDYFTRMLEPSFRVLAVHPEAHGYQTAYVLEVR